MNKKGMILTGCVVLLVHFAGCTWTGSQGPLRVSEENPRYFTDGSGKAVYLTGSHTWNNLVEMSADPGQDPFDYDAFLDFLETYNHNFFRLWAWDLLTWNTSGNNEENSRTLAVYPQPWLRTGPGLALDGEPKFDLTAFNPEYFQRLAERVRKAADRDMYVAVMLFEGWGTQFSPGAYPSHPFHPSNNLQDLPLSPDDSLGLSIYTLEHGEITTLQEAYVRKVIGTVSEFDNVLFEISNENHPGSTQWQYHMIRFIQETEAATGRSHPVGMTFQYRGGSNQTLFDSPADWISPNPEGGYRDDPPAGTGDKVIITDTDHLWGIGGNRQWVWLSFFRGLNPIFMDPYRGKVLERGAGSGWAEEIRTALGLSRQMAGRIDLLHCIPSGHLSSSGYCLARHDREYLVYVPDDQPVTLDLTEARGTFRATWLSALDGRETAGQDMEAGQQVTLSPPFPEGEALLHLKK
jgi:hypothetical protein